jgi:hypothetical protein
MQWKVKMDQARTVRAKFAQQKRDVCTERTSLVQINTHGTTAIHSSL